MKTSLIVRFVFTTHSFEDHRNWHITVCYRWCCKLRADYPPLTICLHWVDFLAMIVLIPSLISSALYNRIFQSAFLSSPLSTTLPVHFLNTVPRGNPVRCGSRFPDCINTEIASMRWCTAEVQARMTYSCACQALLRGCRLGKQAKWHKMIKQTSILDVFSTLHTGAPNTSGSRTESNETAVEGMKKETNEKRNKWTNKQIKRNKK